MAMPIYLSSIVNYGNKFFFFITLSFVCTFGYNIFTIIIDAQMKFDVTCKISCKGFAANLYSSGKLAYIFYDRIVDKEDWSKH